MDEKSLKELKTELAKFKKVGNGDKRPRSSKMGVLFDEIKAFLDDYKSSSNVIQYLYQRLSDGQDSNPRSAVVHQLLKYLYEINILSKKNSASKYISIPLYDMKIIGELLNLIIIYGIYEIVPSKYLLPLESRRLKDFRHVGKLIHADFVANQFILKDILNTFNEIFQSDSDLKDLILVGVGLTDMLTILIVFYLQDKDDQYLSELLKLESYSSTYQLLSYYTLLLKYCQDNKMKLFLRQSKLPELIMKPNGVESIIDLILGLRENEDIDINRVNHIVMLILGSKPPALSLDQYYKCIFDQLYKSLVFVNRPIMTTVIVEILLIIYDKNSNIVTDFIFQRLWTTFNPSNHTEDIILTSGVELNNGFNVCLSIIRCLKQSNQSFLMNLLNPIWAQIWWYANFQRKTGKDADVVLNMIKNGILLEANTTLVTCIIEKLIQPITYHWKFAQEHQEGNLTCIKYNSSENMVGESSMLHLFDVVDYNIETFILLVKRVVEVDEERLNEILITILEKSINQTLLILDDDLPLNKLINLKLLQAMIETFKDQVEKSPIALLSFLNSFLTQYFENLNDDNLHIVKKEPVDSDDEDDEENELNDLEGLIPIFELIGNWTPSNKDEQTHLNKLQTKIKSNADKVPVSLQFIAKRIVDIDTESPVKERGINEDAKLETILKQINDPTPSIRVFALDELTKMTKNGMKVSTKYTINLLLNQLKDPEPFVYLNSIKNISSLLQFDTTHLSHILEMYKTKKSIDERLRLGEAIAKFIQIQGSLLVPEQVDQLVDTTTELIKPQSPSIDMKIRMSSLSLLGVVCHHTGLGILPHIENIIDIIKGIMTFEVNETELRRASIVIIHDIVSNPHGLEILQKYGPSIENMLKYVHEFDNDLLVTQLSWETLVEIDEAFQTKLTL